MKLRAGRGGMFVNYDAMKYHTALLIIILIRPSSMCIYIIEQ